MNKQLVANLLYKIYQYELVNGIDLVKDFMAGNVDQSYNAWAEICQLLREVEEEYESEKNMKVRINNVSRIK